MKRNVLKIGKSSLAVSLPKAFVEQNKINSGQEINVEQKGSFLVINYEQKEEPHKELDVTDFDISNFSIQDVEKFLYGVLGRFFRRGINKIVLKCADEEQMTIIKQIISEGKLQMYQESSNNEVAIYSPVKQFETSSLDVLIKAMIKLIYGSLHDFLVLVEENKISEEELEKLYKKDKIINDYTDICKRLINEKTTDYKSTNLYLFVDNIEKIGDAVKHMVKKCDGKIMPYVDLVEEIMGLLELLLRSKTRFSLRKANDFYAKTNDILEEIQHISNKEVYFYLRSITDLIYCAYGNIATISL